MTQICAGAFLVSMIASIFPRDEQMKWLCGLILIVVVIFPLRQFDLQEFWQITDEIGMDARAITTQAREDTLQSIRQGIIERTRAYILDEAEALGVQIRVIALSLDEEKLTPDRVELQGNMSAYVRGVLSDQLEKDLGIGKEDQIWRD